MNTISFADRVVIVTGSGGGIGRSHALDIASRGGSVVVNDSGGDIEGRHPSPAMADRVATEITQAGGRAIANHDSVATADGAGRLIRQTLDKFGRIDAVINNAGIMRNAWFEQVSEEDFDAQLDVHLRGSFFVTQAAWPTMKAQKYGRVVFTSSATGMYGNRMQTGYAAAKAGVTGVMNVLAQEGEEFGILCNAIMPNASGRMADRMGQDMGAQGREQAAALMAKIGRSFEPAFNTGIAVYLASASCTSTHGLYSSCVGRIARVFVGVSKGWQGSRDRPASAEDIATHFGEITDLTQGFTTPKFPRNEIGLVLGEPGAGKSHRS